MSDCYVFLGINNNGVYQLPTGYINDIRHRRGGGTWHKALTDITLKVISDLPGLCCIKTFTRNTYSVLIFSTLDALTKELNFLG